MATIKSLTTGKIITLRANHIFGRSQAKADTLLENKDISQIHASIRWNDSHWIVLDHSTNGTWIDTSKIVPRQTTSLKTGEIIRFGNSNTAIWEVIDLSPPKTMLTPLNNQSPAIEINHIYAIPNEKKPEITIYLSEAGYWIIEKPNSRKKLNDGDVIYHEEKQWKFSTVNASELTQQSNQTSPISLSEISFRFNVSLDEEHVFIQFTHNNQNFYLGERAHNYLLLTLARQRLKDISQGLDSSSQGWLDIETLSSLLRHDPSHINIQIFRARKKMAELAKDTFTPLAIVERRLGSVRFPYSNIEIYKGDTKESTTDATHSAQTALQSQHAH